MFLTFTGSKSVHELYTREKCAIYPGVVGNVTVTGLPTGVASSGPTSDVFSPSLGGDVDDGVTVGPPRVREERFTSQDPNECVHVTPCGARSRWCAGSKKTHRCETRGKDFSFDSERVRPVSKDRVGPDLTSRVVWTGHQHNITNESDTVV